MSWLQKLNQSNKSPREIDFSDEVHFKWDSFNMFTSMLN